MSAERDLAAARARADLAKRRLLQSTHEFQERVAPARLANDALATAKERGAVALDHASQEVQRYPGTFVAIGLGIVALLARHRIAGLFRRKRPPTTYTIKTAARHALPGPKGDTK